MRTREEIIKELRQARETGAKYTEDSIIWEILLDIREALLTKPK